MSTGFGVWEESPACQGVCVWTPFPPLPPCAEYLCGGTSKCHVINYKTLHYVAFNVGFVQNMTNEKLFKLSGCDVYFCE